jgi:lactoylglutathione lyase
MRGWQGWNRGRSDSVRAGDNRRRCRLLPVAAAILALLVASMAPQAQTIPSSQSPRITGLAHMAYYVTNLARARAWYEGFLGFQEAFALKHPDGAEYGAYVKINDHRYIILLQEPPKNHGYMHDMGLMTNNAEGMRAHLASLGIPVPPEVTRNLAGNLSFDLNDPAGFTIQVVQYTPGSLTSHARGKFMPKDRISIHIDHIGLLQNSKQAAWSFYSKAFGFVKDGNGTKMTIPGSHDRFEIGFERKPASIARYHVKDHICLSVPDVPATVAMLNAKPQAKNYRAIETHVLPNGKHVAELYGPDGNRIELMEPPKS